jgi:ubiquitin C-terminal hydrolase
VEFDRVTDTTTNKALVDFPIKQLSLKNVTLQPNSAQNNAKYNLRTILSFEGEFDSGQYVVFAKKKADEWKCFAKNRMSTVRTGDINKSDAVILMYEK